MNNRKYRRRFYEDAHEFLGSVREILNTRVSVRGAGHPVTGHPAGGHAEAVRGVNELFRLFHSLKSEASQVGAEEFSRVAHELESELVSVRNGDIGLTPKIRDTIFEGVSRLEQMLSREESNEAKQRSAFAKSASGSENPAGFNEFERRILQEAMKRGDRFYRLTCTIDADSVFKQPRAYLIVNNLELISNVIKTVPPLSANEEGEFSTFVAYLTAGVNESELYRAANVDEVDRIRIERLTIVEDGIVTGASDSEAEREKPELSGQYRIEPETLDRVFARLSELKTAVSEGVAGRRAQSLMGDIESMLREVSRRPCSELFDRTIEVVESISAQLEKEITVQTAGGDIEIDTRLIDSLADPLFHVVRNAVDHGIEPPDQRERNGKSRYGHIGLSAGTDAGMLEVTVEDDGRGIDISSVAALARQKGFDVSDSTDLLSILGRPGFTTIDSATDLSGRGFGLDIVMQRISGIGGSVELESTPEAGTSVRLRIPLPEEPGGVLVVRYGERQLSIPRTHSASVIPFAHAELRRDMKGRLLMDRKPVYSPDGRMAVAKGVPREGFLIGTRIKNAPAWLFVDEVLFERVGPEQYGDDVEPLNVPAS